MTLLSFMRIADAPNMPDIDLLSPSGTDSRTHETAKDWREKPANANLDDEETLEKAHVPTEAHERCRSNCYDMARILSR